CDFPCARESGAVASTVRHGGGEADAMRCSFAQARQQPCRAAHDNQFKPEDMRQQVVKTKNAFTLFGTKISEREQAGEPSPAGTVPGRDKNVRRALDKHEPGT